MTELQQRLSIDRAEPKRASRPLGTRIAKRAFDIALGAVALVVTLPLTLLIAAAIAIDSGGPVFFRQTRIGLDGAPFRIWKFRTMVPDAERLGPNVSPTSDPRITRVGSVLRNTYLDELPQLLNILGGSMSFVGPRPETPEFVALYSPAERRVLTVKPGLVGPSTLDSMNESELLERSGDPKRFYVEVLMHRRVAMDLTYVDRAGLVTDIGILIRQAASILRRS